MIEIQDKATEIRLNDLAREKAKKDLLKDILFDLEVSKLIFEDKEELKKYCFKYFRELKELIDYFHKQF